MSRWHFEPCPRTEEQGLLGPPFICAPFFGMVRWDDGDIYYYLGEQNSMGSTKQCTPYQYWTKLWEMYKDDPIHGPIVMSKLMELNET